MSNAIISHRDLPEWVTRMPRDERHFAVFYGDPALTIVEYVFFVWLDGAVELEVARAHQPEQSATLNAQHALPPDVLIAAGVEAKLIGAR